MKTIPLPRLVVSSFPIAALLAITLAPQTASAVPVSASMGAGVEVYLYPSSTLTGTGTSNAAWTNTPTSLSVNASRSGSNPAGSTVTAYANGTATWAANGNSGTATFNYGWATTQGAGDYPLIGLQTNMNLPNWSYTFTADANGFFTMSYNITAPGGLPSFGGLQNFYIGSDGGSTLNLNSIGSGTYTQAVTAGVTYNVAFQNGGNVFDDAVPYSAGVQTTFSWSLPGGAPPSGGGGNNSVPDAGSSALLLTAALTGFTALSARLKKSAA